MGREVGKISSLLNPTGISCLIKENFCDVKGKEKTNILATQSMDWFIFYNYRIKFNCTRNQGAI